MRRGEWIVVLKAGRRGFGLVELVSVFVIGAIISGMAFALFSSGWWYGGSSAAAWREAYRLARWISAAVRHSIQNGQGFTIYPPAGTMETRIRLTWRGRDGNPLPYGEGDRWWTSDRSCYILSRGGSVAISNFIQRRAMFVPGFTVEVRHRRRLSDPPDCYVIVSPYAYVTVSATPPP